MSTKPTTTGMSLTAQGVHKGAGPFDSEQPPDSGFNNVGVVDNGGPILTNVEVAVVFWGTYWNNVPSTDTDSDTYYQAFVGLVTGPFLTGLRQYRGAGPGSMLGKFINDSSDPVKNYTDADLTNMLTTYFNNNSAIPAPTSGHNRYYAVITPPNIFNSIGDANGQHISLTYNGINAYCAWIDNEGSLSNSYLGVLEAFSHELAEACSDPSFGNSIMITATDNSGKPITGQEIGDVCRGESAEVYMNGVQGYVQCYWSEADQACILPLGSLSFLINKNTFGKDEVQEMIKNSSDGLTGTFSNSFFLLLNDFSPNTFSSFNVAVPVPSGPFSSLSGVEIQLTPSTAANPNPSYVDFTNGSLIQTIRYSYDVVFTSDNATTHVPIAPFPTSGQTAYSLNATFTTDGWTVPGINSQDSVNFELVSGEDPYFMSIDPTDNAAVAYLSQDLRVFSIPQGQSALPSDPTAPTFDASQTPYDYIQSLIGYLNGSTTYSVPVPQTSPDPLNNLVGQTGYETGDSSVTPLDAAGNKNYNFAIARVRMTSDVQGSAGEANNVRVFFRLWIATSCDTDFNPNTTYLSNPPYSTGLPPTNPLASAANTPPDPQGNAIQTQPFFATDASGTNDYVVSTSYPNNNIRPIQIPQVAGQDSIWTYYGCFLDVYDSNNNTGYPGTHHCIVAQIAYDNAPIQFGTGTAINPGNTDKLAQRNLQISSSGNPGPPPTHRVPQAFDTRPSAPYLAANGAVLNQPDQLMLDWGSVPTGTPAQIYWPEASSSDVLTLAMRLYGGGGITAIDTNTIGVTAVTNGATYIPIPAASGKNFAGLLTLDLPMGIRAGQEYNVLVRRIATQQLPTISVPQIARPGPVLTAPPTPTKIRYVTGAFLVKIPVVTDEALLPTDVNTLAIFKARLAAMDPQYRWYPVLQRYIEYLSGRIEGAGGNPGAVPPNLNGWPPRGGYCHRRKDCHRCECGGAHFCECDC